MPTKKEKSKSFKLKFYLLGGFILLLIIFILLTSGEKISCGDSICSDGENECNCPSDCGECISLGKSCEESTCEDGFCISKKIVDCCGNNLAEEGENCLNCEQDVHCAFGESCFEGECVKINWNCSSWSDCSKEGIKTRICTEKNNLSINKPDEREICKSYSLLKFNSRVEDSYEIGDIKEIYDNSSALAPTNKGHFLEGAIIDLTKYNLTTYSVKDYYEITIGIYIFDSSYQSKMMVDFHKEDLEYDSFTREISLSNNCFSWEEDYGYESRFAHAICYEKEMVYWIDVTLVNSFEEPSTELKFINEIMKNRF